MKKEISNEDYRKKLAIAKENEPKVISTTLKNIIIESDSFDKEYIILILNDGSTHQLTVAPSFFKQLAKILNINLSIKKNLTDQKDDNSVYSELLNALRQIQTSVKPIELTLLYSPIDRKITHVKAGAFARLSNSSLINFAESLVNKFPKLTVADIDAYEGSPNFGIKILSGNIVDFTDKNLSEEDESFQFGITLGNSGLTTSVGDFAYRLICSNGIMGIRTDERFFLENTEQDGLRKMFDYFEKMKEQNFIPDEFAAKFENATKTHASYKELKDAHNFAQRNLFIEFPEQEAQTRAAFADKYFNDIARVQARLKTKGIDEKEIPDKAMQLIRTKTSMWELVNTLTDLGSNSHHVFKVGNKQNFQRMGGGIMSKNWDLEFEDYLLL